MDSIYSFKVKDNSGNEVDMSAYEGKVLLIVNTASKCGFTPQYEDLQLLYNKYKDQNLEILGFPCNQFGGQEPGSNNEIQEFCTLNFGVNFPLFDKIDVNGDNASPLYEFLKKELPGLLGTQKIKWNFTKFLIDKDGTPIKRFAPQDKGDKIELEIKKLI